MVQQVDFSWTSQEVKLAVYFFNCWLCEFEDWLPRSYTWIIRLVKELDLLVNEVREVLKFKVLNI